MKTCFFLPLSRRHLAGCCSSAASRLPQTEQNSAPPLLANQNELTADRFSKNTNSNTRQSSISLLLSLAYQSGATANRGHIPLKETEILLFEHRFSVSLVASSQEGGRGWNACDQQGQSIKDHRCCDWRSGLCVTAVQTCPKASRPLGKNTQLPLQTHWLLNK